MQIDLSREPHMLQDRLDLLVEYRLLGSDFSSLCARLCRFCPGFSLFCACLRRFGPCFGLLGSCLSLFSSGFGLLNSRLITVCAHMLIIFFHFAFILSRETSQGPWGIYPICLDANTPSTAGSRTRRRDPGRCPASRFLSRVKHGAEVTMDDSSDLGMAFGSAGVTMVFRCVATIRISGCCPRKPLSCSSRALAGDLPEGNL